MERLTLKAVSDRHELRARKPIATIPAGHPKERKRSVLGFVGVRNDSTTSPALHQAKSEHPTLWGAKNNVII